mgnify:CR=1 FL=1
MEGFLHAVSSVTIILLLTATGYFCAARGWMGPQAKAFIGKFTLSVAIPCMSVYGLTNNLTRDLLVQSGSFLLVPLLGTVVITILSLLVSRLLKLPSSFASGSLPNSSRYPSPRPDYSKVMTRSTSTSARCAITITRFRCQ